MSKLGLKNIAVLAGGDSGEREVSLRSGEAVADALRRLGYLVDMLDPLDPSVWDRLDHSLVFLALHGVGGEDGETQARLDQMGLCYTGSDAPSSRLAFDKVVSKKRFETIGAPTPRSTSLDCALAQSGGGLNFPVVVKPARSGSSLELFFVDTLDALLELKLAMPVAEYLVEEQIIGREFTVAILGETAMPVVEIVPKAGLYDYTNKYTDGGARYYCPADLEAPIARAMADTAVQVFFELGCRDYGRVDFMMDSDSNFFTLEVNTLPGMTETSLFPKAAKAAGHAFEGVCEEMARLAWERR